jgi:riboflavin synthase
MTHLLSSLLLLSRSAVLLSAFSWSSRVLLPGKHPRRRVGINKGSIIRSMFSGIVEEMGEVVSLSFNSSLELWDGSFGSGTELVVKSPTGLTLEGAYEGASIAINGVCTTVTSFDSTSFKVGLAPETLRRSNLGGLLVGQQVNLERSLRADGRNSGHFVQGHVDCTGTIISKNFEGDSLWVKVSAPYDVLRFIVPKGFIAIDGTSLTVCDVNYEESWFSVMLVSFTQSKIVVPFKSVGSHVNLEADVFGKYVDRSVATLVKRVESLEKKLEALSSFCSGTADKNP